MTISEVIHTLMMAINMQKIRFINIEYGNKKIYYWQVCGYVAACLKRPFVVLAVILETTLSSCRVLVY